MPQAQVPWELTLMAVSTVGYVVYFERFGQPQFARSALVKSLIVKAIAEVEGHRLTFPPTFCPA